MRLIDADALKEIVKREMWEPWAKGMGDAICRMLDAAGEYKTAPLVHCKDCKHCQEVQYGQVDGKPYIKRRCTNEYVLRNSGHAVFADFYCAYGDEKEEAENDSISDC